MYTKEYFVEKGKEGYQKKLLRYGKQGMKEKQREAALKGWQKRRNEKN